MWTWPLRFSQTWRYTHRYIDSVKSCNKVNTKSQILICALCTTNCFPFKIMHKHTLKFIKTWCHFELVRTTSSRIYQMPEFNWLAIDRPISLLKFALFFAQTSWNSSYLTKLNCIWLWHWRYYVISLPCVPQYLVGLQRL